MREKSRKMRQVWLLAQAHLNAWRSPAHIDHHGLLFAVLSGQTCHHPSEVTFAASAGQFLDSLPGDERRKSGWMRAEAAGDKSPRRQRAILGRGSWDADALHDIVRDHALETLADPGAMLVLVMDGEPEKRMIPCIIRPANGFLK